MSIVNLYIWQTIFNQHNITYLVILVVENMVKIHINLLILKIYELHNYMIKSFFCQQDKLLKMVPKFNEIYV